MGVWARRGVAVAASLVAFGGCWLGLVLADPKIDMGVALGWSVLPLTVVLTVAMAWAEAGRPRNGRLGQLVMGRAPGWRVLFRGRRSAGSGMSGWWSVLVRR